MLLSSSWAISIRALVFSFSKRAKFSSFEYFLFFVSTNFLIHSYLVHKSKNRKKYIIRKIEKSQLRSYSIRDYNAMTLEIRNLWQKILGAVNTVNKSKLKTFWGWNVQTEIKITIIDISCKFYLRKLHEIYILHQISCSNNRPPKKTSPKMKRIAYSSSFTPCKN